MIVLIGKADKRLGDMSKQTVLINGKEYDKQTGMPISSNQSVQNTIGDNHHAHSVHQSVAKSKTLDRRYVKRTIPAVSQTAFSPAPVATKLTMNVSMTQTKSEVAKPAHVISKFHKPQRASMDMVKPQQKPAMSDISPRTHPMVQAVEAARVKQSSSVQKTTTHKPSDVIKTEAMQKAMDSAPSGRQRNKAKAPKLASKNRASRRLTFASAGVAMLLIGGYFTYINMPNISVRVAAAQAGIDASYPNYRPSGYSLAGPVAYDNGKVQMKFASNGGPQNFVLSQERSGWDSEAVLSNYVTPKAGESYTINKDSGLTVYVWENNAAWVSGGILYTVNGDAPLAPDQIRRMATSL